MEGSVLWGTEDTVPRPDCRQSLPRQFPELAHLPTSGLALLYNSQNELLCVSSYLHTVKFTLFGVHFYTFW